MYYIKDNDPNFDADMLYRYFLFGYKGGVAQVVKDFQKGNMISMKAGDVIRGASLSLAFSTPVMRTKINLDFHDLSKVDNGKDYVHLKSLKRHYMTVGGSLGVFVAHSGLTAASGRNFIHSSEDYLGGVLKGYAFIPDAIEQTTDEIVRSDTMEIGKPGFFMDALAIAKSKTSREHFEDVISSFENRFANSSVNGEPTGVFLVGEELPTGCQLAPCHSKLKLAIPVMNGSFPEDHNESEAFSKIVEKNPGYGLPFWELIRTIAKDHGAYFVPSLSLDEEFARSRGPVASRNILDRLRELTTTWDKGQ